MVTIYRLSPAGCWSGETAEVDAAAPAPAGWTRAQPPLLAPGECARWSGTGWAAAAAPAGAGDLERRRADLIDAVKAVRYARETGGASIGGVLIDTSRDSQGLILGAAVQAGLSPDYSVRWKAANGTWVDLDAAAILAVATQVRAHVQVCFDREFALTQQIQAAADGADLDAININEGWPQVGPEMD